MYYRSNFHHILAVLTTAGQLPTAFFFILAAAKSSKAKGKSPHIGDKISSFLVSLQASQILPVSDWIRACLPSLWHRGFPIYTV
jgi:hypothetical protein